LLLPRGAVNSLSQRYLLPLLVVALVAVLRLYQEKVGASPLPVLSLVYFLIVAAYSVAAMHDFYAMERTRLTLANEIRSVGVPRTGFYGGFDYDSWTQVESWGYVTSSDINLPPGIQPIPSGPPSFAPCSVWYADLVPAIHPSYALSFDQLACDSPSRFAPALYHTWLPPYSGSIYVQTVRTGAAPIPRWCCAGPGY
jgi:hypothetical protein